MEWNSKKAILVVSFGTSYEDTRKLTIEAVENKIKAAFSGYEVKRAFTSGIIRKILKKRDNIVVLDTKSSLESLKNEGFKEVIVQPLHIIPGIEYEKVQKEVEEFKEKGAFEKLVLGEPLLYKEEDYIKVIDALKKQMPPMKEGEAVVLMGHGSSHFSNASYALMQYMLEENGLYNVLIGTVEGYPTLDNVIRRLKNKNIKEVTLMPLMLVAGDHARNDMAGEEEDSWKSILEKEGFNCKAYVKGLGENKYIQDMYVEKVKSL
ncbi:sirohydrochlorin cobaltochelatase [Haloimpatiens sp. FM7315]|uniref:sirohydrochlorin cobaltochelatase n=1 Tax=Haloimpatiens sp. FM7315 TaxID=3298609 RepID=UPI00370C26DF